MTTAQHTEHYDPTIRGLAGKTVKRVRHLVASEVEGMGWYQNPYNNVYTGTIVIEFTDGSYAIVSSDEEGNDAGHLIVEEYEQ
jgi:hypothetical protein